MTRVFVAAVREPPQVKDLSRDQFETVSNFLPPCHRLAILDYWTIIKEPCSEAERGPK